MPKCSGCETAYRREEMEHPSRFAPLLCLSCADKWRPSCARCDRRIEHGEIHRAYAEHRSYLCETCSGLFKDELNRRGLVAWSEFVLGTRSREDRLAEEVEFLRMKLFAAADAKKIAEDESFLARRTERVLFRLLDEVCECGYCVGCVSRREGIA